MAEKTDCSFIEGKDRFRYRVGGIVVCGSYALFGVNEKCDYYYTVGGGVHMGEKSEDAILRELYEETGEASAIPPVAEYYFNVDKERNIMTAEERTKYQKVFGQEAVKQVNSALDFKPYGKLSDAEKVDVIEDIYSYAKALARAEVSDYELSGNDAKAAEAEQKGIAAATYFIYKATGDLNGNGSINQEEAKKALDKLPLTKAQKATLWQLTNSQWSVKNNPYR